MERPPRVAHQPCLTFDLRGYWQLSADAKKCLQRSGDGVTMAYATVEYKLGVRPQPPVLPALRRQKSATRRMRAKIRDVIVDEARPRLGM